MAIGCDLIVIPRSRSRSMASSSWSCDSRIWIVPVNSSKRSDSVVLPWSIWAMIQKLRVVSMDELGTVLAVREKVADYGGQAPFGQPERDDDVSPAILAD